MGQTEEPFGFFHRCFDGIGLVHRGAEGLVEHDMVACFERRDGGCGMHMVGRGDHNDLDTLVCGALELRGEQLLPTAVGAVVGDA